MKRFKIIFSIIIASLIVLIGAYYYFAYIVPPKVFDYFIEKNIEAVRGLEKDIEKNAEKGLETEIEKNIIKQEEKGNNNIKKPESSSAPEQTSQPTPQYEAKTSIGSFSNADLLRAMKNISPSDKAKIIGILKAGVPSSQIPKFAAMAKDGLDIEEKKYIENYMRANLPNSSKQQILNIISKYIK
jgi:hypothetical protein